MKVYVSSRAGPRPPNRGRSRCCRERLQPEIKTMKMVCVSWTRYGPWAAWCPGVGFCLLKGEGIYDIIVHTITKIDN